MDRALRLADSEERIECAGDGMLTADDGLRTATQTKKDRAYRLTLGPADEYGRLAVGQGERQ